MSDAQDWTGISAGATQVLAQGSGLVVPSGGTFGPINFTAPQSTRSLLILLLCTNAPVGGVTPGGWNVEGQTSLQLWESSGAVTPQLDTSFHTNTSAQAMYVPFYGAVDAQGQFWFQITGGPSTWSYWILGLPDPDILGTDVAPIQVEPAASLAGLHPVLPVILQDANGVRQGVPAAPLYTGETDPHPVTAHTLSRTSSLSGNVTLFAAPPAGHCWEVVSVGINVVGTASSNNATAVVGLSSGGVILQQWAGPNGQMASWSGKLYLAEAIQAQMFGTLTGSNATVGARLVPLN